MQRLTKMTHRHVEIVGEVRSLHPDHTVVERAGCKPAKYRLKGRQRGRKNEPDLWDSGAGLA